MTTPLRLGTPSSWALAGPPWAAEGPLLGTATPPEAPGPGGQSCRSRVAAVGSQAWRRGSASHMTERRHLAQAVFAGKTLGTTHGPPLPVLPSGPRTREPHKSRLLACPPQAAGDLTGLSVHLPPELPEVGAGTGAGALLQLPAAGLQPSWPCLGTVGRGCLAGPRRAPLSYVPLSPPAGKGSSPASVQTRPLSRARSGGAGGLGGGQREALAHPARRRCRQEPPGPLAGSAQLESGWAATRGWTSGDSAGLGVVVRASAWDGKLPSLSHLGSHHPPLTRGGVCTRRLPCGLGQSQAFSGLGSHFQTSFSHGPGLRTGATSPVPNVQAASGPGQACDLRLGLLSSRPGWVRAAQGWAVLAPRPDLCPCSNLQILGQRPVQPWLGYVG